jgi:dolichol-phosphate mannosyltransferase
MNNYHSSYLGVVTPMANESSTAIKFADSVLCETLRYPFRKISIFPILDNVCTDGTRELLDDYAKTENRLVVVYAPENRCVVDAYMRGYKAALDAGCDWILEMDAGFSHDPASIPAFLAKIPDGFDVIYATRFTLGGKIVDSGFRRKCLSRFGGIVSNLLLGTKLGDMTSGFILYSRSALEQILAEGVQSKGPFFQTEMKYHARNLCYAEVPITYSGASHHIGKKAMDDAKFHLRRLFRERLTSMFR